MINDDEPSHGRALVLEIMLEISIAPHPLRQSTGTPSHFINSQLVRLILEKYSLFRLSKVDLGNCILSKVLLKTRKLGNKSTKN